MLEPETCALIADTEALHERIARLDAAWREGFLVQPTAVHGLRDRIGRALGSL
jgi:regulator of CtrA degradation